MKAKLAATCIIGLLFICALSTWGVTTALAGIEPVPWLPTSGGFDNPIFWVLFNPQPEPPGDWFTYSVNSQGEAVFTAQYGANGLRLMFGVSSLTGLLNNMSLSLTADGFTSLVLSGTQPIYRADFTFDSGGMLFPGSLVAFNPQPEPPGAPYIKQWVTFDLLDAAGGSVLPGTDVNMTMRLMDTNGNLVKLEPAPVPEPATVLLFGAGMSFLVGIGIRRKRC